MKIVLLNIKYGAGLASETTGSPILAPILLYLWSSIFIIEAEWNDSSSKSKKIIRVIKLFLQFSD